MILNYYWYGKKKDTFVKGDATLVLKFRLRVGPMIVLVFYFWTFAKPIHLSNYERERERERERNFRTWSNSNRLASMFPVACNKSL